MAKSASDGRAFSGQAHASLLTELGFPAGVVENAAEAVEGGLFNLEPSPELLRRTVEACQAAVAQKPAAQQRLPQSTSVPENLVIAYGMILDDLVDLIGSPSARPALMSVGRLVSECMSTIGFVRQTRERPMMVLDNHSIVDPLWWSSDTGFIALRDTLKTVNEAALEVAAPPSAVIMILQPHFGSYRDNDFRSMYKAFMDKSDVWLLPHEMAGGCKNYGAVVFGDGRAITLNERRDTPGAAFSAFQEIWGERAGSCRAAVEAITSKVSISRHRAEMRQGPHAVAELRQVVKQVIETGEAVRFMD